MKKHQPEKPIIVHQYQGLTKMRQTETERTEKILNLCIHSEYRKIRTRNTPNTYTLFAVRVLFYCLMIGCNHESNLHNKSKNDKLNLKPK